MKIAIVDIDGTLSIVGDRKKYLQQNPPNWDEFYSRCWIDSQFKEIVDLVWIIQGHYDIILCTGRRESCRKDTVEWLDTYNINYEELLMRPNGDTRHDTILKPELIEKAGIKLKDVSIVLEDRSSMVKKWRELGFTCLQVADGDF